MMRGLLNALSVFAISGALLTGSICLAKGAGPSGEPIVLLKTTKGDIKVQIFTKEAPLTATNFLDLVNRHFYDGLTFHRVEPGFVIQGGDPRGNGTGGFMDPKTHQERTIKLETSANLKHDAGALAMARSSDPNSASSQFYITLAPAHALDGQYAVFGKVVSGMDNVLKIKVGDKMLKVNEAK